MYDDASAERRLLMDLFFNLTLDITKVSFFNLVIPGPFRPLIESVWFRDEMLELSW